MGRVPVLPGLDLALTPELRFILDLGVALALALVFGALATRFGQPPIVGYLAAGVVIGPFTPGFVGNQEQIGQLAELGVVLLLFALGVEFSLHELRRVWRIAVPGAIAQIVITAVAGAAVVILLGMSPVEGAVIGSAIAISSTLVVLKILVERGEMDSLHGRAAIGWMVVQDLVTIILIALLEPLAGGGSAAPVLFALVRAAAFMALAYIVGTRLLPWLFRTVSRLGSPELFLLSVFATALLAAFLSSAVFGLSLALGAFVAGLIVSESDLSHQAAGEIIPFRDLFAVLFFVSVGMLLDPAALVDDWPALLALLAVAVGVKAAASAGLGRMLGLPLRSALLLGATIAQVGEFSFLLAEQALHVELIDARGYNLILATAILSIVLTPTLVRGAASLAVRIEHRVAVVDPPIPGQAPTTRGELGLADEDRLGAIVILGGGRVGRVVVRAVRARGFRCVVVDRDQRVLDELAEMGAATLYGDAASRAILARTGLERARLMVVAIADPMSAQLAVERAREINPRLMVAARARGRLEIRTMRGMGVARLADPEVEAALELARATLARMGISGPEQAAITTGLRRRAYGDPAEARVMPRDSDEPSGRG
ncbi:MAG: monovalent cation:H+ antiporter-2, family [Chloroflexota bacterium]|nr:monovalent cation:H+ antiporter-2, family [Chloroflexota bacterium]